jgi:gamma-glutamyl phosphate reductase
MNSPASEAPTAPAESSELDALLCAISEAIEALVAWNITELQAAMARQSAICERLALKPELRRLPATAATVRKIQDLNRAYDRLLRHSMQWTRTLHAVFQAGGDPYPRRAAVHFRG